jgi:hypothetical protein
MGKLVPLASTIQGAGSNAPRAVQPCMGRGQKSWEGRCHPGLKTRNWIGRKKLEQRHPLLNAAGNLMANAESRLVTGTL